MSGGDKGEAVKQEKPVGLSLRVSFDKFIGTLYNRHKEAAPIDGFAPRVGRNTATCESVGRYSCFYAGILLAMIVNVDNQGDNADD